MKFRSQTFKAARFCVRRKAEAEDVQETEVGPIRARLRSVGLVLGNQQEEVEVEVGMDSDGEDGN